MKRSRYPQNLILRARATLTALCYAAAVASLAIFSRPMVAQGPPVRSGWLLLTVRDSATGEPLAGAWARIDSTEGLAPIDSAGQFLFYRVPPGKREITIICPTRLWWFGPRVTHEPILARAGDTVAVDVRVPAAACLVPGLRSIGGEFRGHYRGGFEESSFRPCPRDQQAPGSPEAPWKAWVEFDSLAMARGGRWPTVPDTGYGSTWYVKVYGTLSGPGTYGHMGVSKYQLDVSEIRQVRAPRRNDCPSEPEDW